MGNPLRMMGLAAGLLATSCHVAKDEETLKRERYEQALMMDAGLGELWSITPSEQFEPGRGYRGLSPEPYRPELLHPPMARGIERKSSAKLRWPCGEAEYADLLLKYRGVETALCDSATSFTVLGGPTTWASTCGRRALTLHDVALPLPGKDNPRPDHSRWIELRTESVGRSVPPEDPVFYVSSIEFVCKKAVKP